MARNKKVEILSHDGQVLHPITDGDCVIFPDGETLTHKLSEQEEVMYTPEVVNSSPMFKVGEGDSSDYSSSVLDGAYQEAILKGQTYVNTIQEPSADEITLPTPFTEYERTQSKTFTEMNSGTFGINLVGQSYVNCIQEPSEPSYVALGENLEFQNKKVEYTTDGQIKSAMLNGMTLVNLGKDLKYEKSTNNDSYSNILTKIENMKTNTTYIVIAKVKSSHSLSSVSPSSFFRVEKDSDGYTLGGVTGDITTEYITKSFTFNTGNETKIRLILRNAYSGWGLTENTAYIKEVMIIEYQEGMENWDIPYFQGMQSVTMSTELENVCSRYNSSVAKNGKTFTISGSNGRALYLAKVSEISNFNFKQNTKYLMQFKITNLNLDGLESIKLVFSDSSVAKGDALFGDTDNVLITKNGIYRIVLTTSNVVSTSSFVIKGQGVQWESSSSTARKLTISQIMCIEYQNGMENWDLPYFETTQLMKPLKVRSVNKNLFDTANMFNSYKTTVSEVTTNSFRLTGTDSNATYKNTPFIFNVKPNTDYKITFKSETTDADALCDVYDANNKYLGNRNFNSGNNTRVSVRFYVNMNNTKNGTVKYYDVQMEESSTETPYTPHQEKTTSALEPITLRAIGDVKDTLDLSTGEYVQRIGEVVLDGSDDEAWKMGIYSEGDAYRFDTEIISGKIPLVSNTTLANIMCDKYKPITFSDAYYNRGQGIAIFSNTHIVISNGMTNLDDFKSSLQQNPIKVQYQLANPIVRKISLEYPNLQTYTDITHVQSIAMDGTLIPNIFLPSDISYKAMLKPNTKYNVIVDREVISSDNQLTVNLGGTTANITANRTLITTPSTLSNETLTFSGKGNKIGKVMLIENSTLLDGDIPHFDGIGDVKLGRVVENLCMSNEYPEGNGRTTDTYSNNSITSKFTASGSRVYLFDLIKPIQNGKKYFVYAPCSQTCSIGFKTIYNGTASYSVAKTSIDNYTILSIDNEILRECRLFIGQLGAMPVNTTMTIRRPIICEYIDGMENWDWESIGYFTGSRNIGNEFMRISNKNLFDGINRKYYINVETYLMGLTNNDSGGVVDVSNVDNVVVSSTSTQTRFRIGCTNKLPSENGETVVVYNGVNLDSNSSAKASIDCSNYKYLIINAVDLSIVQVEEASSATSYTAHKHNSLHILPNEQIPLTFEQGRISFTQNGTWTDAINNTSTTRIRTQLLDLEPNETYRISLGNSGYKYGMQMWDNSNNGVLDTGLQYTDYYFTTTKDNHKISLVIGNLNDTNITPSVLHQVRLEKVTDVTLRGIGSVKDELDLTRGVYIQRIGEVVLDGSNDENWALYNRDNYSEWSTYQWRCGLPTKAMPFDVDVRSANGLCDKLPFGKVGVDLQEDYEHYRSNGKETGGFSSYVYIWLNQSKASSINELKQFLSKNPITVQYQLATPIEHKINIPMKNESNQTIAKPNGVFTLPLMYSETNHVDINSQIYPKVQSRDYISYPVIANNSQLHTVFHNKVGTGNLTVNLCGTSVTSVDGTSKCTITTPSTISQYELRLSGARNKVSNVCVFSGDYMNVDVPYVQGMMNAVNPIVKNIGKNLFDKNNVIQNYYVNSNGGLSQETGTERNATNYIQIKPNTSYIIDGAKNSGITNNNKQLYIVYYDSNKNYISKYIPFVENTIRLKTPSNAYYLRTTVKNKDLDNFILIEESSTPSQYEPYKENICEPDYGRVYLTQDMLEQGAMYYSHGNSYSSMINNTDTSRIRLKKLLCLKENTTYVIKIDGDYMFALGLFNENEIGVSSSSVSTWKNEYIFTTTSDACKLGFCIRKSRNGAIGVSEFNDCNITLYELDKEIHLRSLPNGVRDELNLQTGEYVQRVGEITFDGSETGWDGNAANNNTFRIRCNVAYINNTTIHAICKEYESRDYQSSWDTGKFISVSLDKKITFRNDNIPQGDTASWKAYLQANPITVQYQLETPIIKQIDIHNYPHSYQNGHVIIESGDPTTPVPAQLTYKCVTNRSGQIQEHTEQVEKQERQINELETLVLENIRQNQNRSQNFLTSLISTLEIEEE